MYTNADQFLNKRSRDNMLMFIAGDEPDIIIMTEVLPKARAHSESISPAH